MSAIINNTSNIASINYQELGSTNQVSLSISSGKGGVGKTVTAVNLAYALQKQGHKVLVLDGDFGLANIDVILGLKAEKNIYDVIEGDVNIKDIILEGPGGMHIIPSGSGISQIVDLQDYQRVELYQQLQDVADEYDVFLVDTGAGISKSVIHLNLASENLLVITSPEPHSITDAYALIKVVSDCNYQGSIHLLVNMTHGEAEGLKVFQRIADVSKSFLGISINYAGFVSIDPQLQNRIMRKSAVSENSLHTLSGQQITTIARELIQSTNNMSSKDFCFAERLMSRYERLEAHKDFTSMRSTSA